MWGCIKIGFAQIEAGKVCSPKGKEKAPTFYGCGGFSFFYSGLPTQSPARLLLGGSKKALATAFFIRSLS